MAYETLQAVVGTAIVDSRFRRSLLAKKTDALQGFELTKEESAAIAQSEATTIQGFAQDLHGWITRRVSLNAGNLS